MRKTLLIPVLLVVAARAEATTRELFPPLVTQTATTPSPFVMSVAPVMRTARHVMDRDGSPIPVCQFRSSSWGRRIHDALTEAPDWNGRMLGESCLQAPPLGTVWVEVRNTGTEPLRVEPAQFTAVAHGKTYRAVDAQSRLDATWRGTMCQHSNDTPRLRSARARVPILTAPATVAPGQTLRFYVTYDLWSARPSFDGIDYLSRDELFFNASTGDRTLTFAFARRDVD